MTVVSIPPVVAAKPAINQVALELTEACNYKCVMCDYWRVPNPKFMPLEMASDLFALFEPGSLNSVLLTGGEPLLHPHWRQIVDLIPPGARKLLCTNGSPILKQNQDVARLFDRITVSIDGATDESFKRIRGFAHLSGIMRSLERFKKDVPSLTVFLKMTIQRHNVREVGPVFDLAAAAGYVDGIGFGIPDFSAAAFGFPRVQFIADDYLDRTVPDAEGIAHLASTIDCIEQNYSDRLSRGFMYEGDLRRYLRRFRALRGIDRERPPPRSCGIPRYSLVLKADGRAAGCYFLGDTCTIDDLRAHGLAFHERRTAGHRSLENRVCRACDQLMNRPPD